LIRKINKSFFIPKDRSTVRPRFSQRCIESKQSGQKVKPFHYAVNQEQTGLNQNVLPLLYLFNPIYK